MDQKVEDRPSSSLENERLRALEEAKEKRQHPHIGLWLRTKLAVISEATGLELPDS